MLPLSSFKLTSVPFSNDLVAFYLAVLMFDVSWVDLNFILSAISVRCQLPDDAVAPLFVY